MLTWIKELLWDKTAARAAVLFLLSAAAGYTMQPTGRTEVERAVVALALAAGVGAATATGPKKQ